MMISQVSLLTPWQAMGLVVLLGTFYILIKSIYRLTFHPLAKYPGPFFAKISNWATPSQCATRDRHLIGLAQHQEYGPVVRIAPNTLSFSSPTALRQIYQFGKETNPLCKGDSYRITHTATGAFTLHTEISLAKHAARRKVLEYAFTGSALRTNEPYVVEAVDTLCRVMAPENEEWSQAWDMNQYLTWFAYDVMGALVFGQKFDCLTDSRNRFVPKLIATSSEFIYPVAYFPCQRLLGWLMRSPKLMGYLGGEIARDDYRFTQHCVKCMDDRLAQEEGKGKSHQLLEAEGQMNERKDLMSYVINNTDKVEGYGRKELDADAKLFVIAGSDTTSTTLAALFHYLTLPSSASILDRLVREVRDESKFPTLDTLTGASVGNLPFLRACIDEALRLAPPVPAHLPRNVVQESGVEIDGHHIPVGTCVGVPAYVVHHDAEAYPNSWAFNPDRWTAEGQNAEQVGQARDAFTAFSLGSRGCIGKDLAYREMSLCVSRLLWQFDIRRSADSDQYFPPPKMRSGIPTRPDEYQLYDDFVSDRHGPRVQLRRRQVL